MAQVGKQRLDKVRNGGGVATAKNPPKELPVVTMDSDGGYTRISDSREPQVPASAGSNLSSKSGSGRTGVPGGRPTAKGTYVNGFSRVKADPRQGPGGGRRGL